MSSTVRSQFLDYNLIRSGRFTPVEHALLNVIVTFSERCEMNQTYLAKAINRSVRTVQRSIDSLIKKGIIDRSYTLFKRCVIRVKTLKQQAELMTAGGILKQLLKKRKKRVIPHDMTPVSEVITTPVSQPTRSETPRNKTIKSELNFQQKDMGPGRNRSDEWFVSEKSRQLAAYLAQQSL